MRINPMLAQKAEKPFHRTNYIYEPKLDGVRCIAYLSPEGTQLQARSGKDITFKFPELANLHKQTKNPCILDGEIIARSADALGHTFNAMQHRIHQQKPFAIKIAQSQYPVTFNGFDQISLDGNSTETVQLIDRKELLVANFVESEVGLLVPWYTDIAVAEELYKDTEGIMAKYIFSTYAQGSRSAHWLKLKNFVDGAFYICGLTAGENARNGTFGSLILGRRDPMTRKLVYVGNVGTGLTDKQLTEMLSLAQIYRSDCPFERVPDVDKQVLFWTRPELVAEVHYLELSNDGKLRFPSFKKVSK